MVHISTFFPLLLLLVALPHLPSTLGTTTLPNPKDILTSRQMTRSKVIFNLQRSPHRRQQPSGTPPQPLTPETPPFACGFIAPETYIRLRVPPTSSTSAFSGRYVIGTTSTDFQIAPSANTAGELYRLTANLAQGALGCKLQPAFRPASTVDDSLVAYVSGSRFDGTTDLEVKFLRSGDPASPATRIDISCVVGSEADGSLLSCRDAYGPREIVIDSTGNVILSPKTLLAGKDRLMVELLQYPASLGG